MSIMLGETIRKLRKERGMTQNDIAEKLYTTAQNISRVEVGEGEPTVEMLIQLADLFSVSADTLLGRKDISEKELLERIGNYIGNAEEHCSKNAVFAICKGILQGCFQRSLSEVYCVTECKAYSTMGGKGITGIYSDIETAPKVFGVSETDGFDFDDFQADKLSSLFGSLSLSRIYPIFSKIYSVMYEYKLYDRESFCKRFDVDENEFADVINALINCNCVETKSIIINQKETEVYRPYISREVMLILQISKLICLNSPDGNARL